MCVLSPYMNQKNIKKALLDKYWAKAMQEKLKQFARNDVWTLVHRPNWFKYYRYQMDFQKQL